MPDTKPASVALRATVAAVVGCTLVTGWLQPVYQWFVGRVFVPNWWIYLHLASLAGLLLLFFFLWKRDWKLSMLTLLALVVSLAPDCIPGHVTAAA